MCIRVTLKGVYELRAHRAHLISYTQRIIFRSYSACYFALSAHVWWYKCNHSIISSATQSHIMNRGIQEREVTVPIVIHVNSGRHPLIFLLCFSDDNQMQV